MNRHRISIGIMSALIAASFAAGARADLGGPSNPAAPLVQNGSAFTYQGQLRQNGAPVNASCDASFSLFDSATGGTQVGGTVTSPTLQVANGLFTIPLDFGWNFSGEARWLDTAIGCGEAQATLTPRTALRPAPYAFALPGMRTVPGSSDGGGNPTMNVIGGVVSGAISNTISAESYNSVIDGGYSSRIDNGSTGSAIGGGYGHLISGTTFSAIGGGYNNRIDNGSNFSAIGGGHGHLISGTSFSAIGGGFYNRIDNGNTFSAIAGGYQNRIDIGSSSSAIGGGSSNVITSAVGATIPGGFLNRVEGDYGFAAGRQAKALHNGTFVWGDSTNADIASTAPNQFIVRASGGVTVFSNAGATVGARLFAGSGSWTSLSDRNLKANPATVNPRAVLDAVAALPVSTWNYTAQDASIRHIGPMAQDFYAAFNVGESDTGISTVDAQGVAFAAIQGLYQQNLDLKAQNAELAARVSALERGPSSGTLAVPAEPANVSTLLSLLAAVGVAAMWLQQRRADRKQA